MLTEQKQVITLEEFHQIVEQNPDTDYELIDGEIWDAVADIDSSELAGKLIIEIGIVMKGKDLGRLTVTDGGYIIDGQNFIPDVAFTRKERVNKTAIKGYLITPPDLAIEVVSPTDTAEKIAAKTRHYVAAGVTLWIVYPSSKTISIYAPNQPFRALTMDDTLDGGELLPGFQLPLKELFG